MSQLSENVVLDALRQIKDPDLHKDIVTLGFIKDLKIDGGAVSFRIVLTTPACPVKAEMESAAHEYVSAIPGVTANRSATAWPNRDSIAMTVCGKPNLLVMVPTRSRSASPLIV